MGIAERKERERLQRREDIVDAAEKVFFSMGLKNATMDDVADAAELSKGTLYLYFKSKEELYLAIHLRGLALLVNLFKKAVKPNMNGLQQTLAIGRAFFRYYQDYPDYFDALSYYEFNDIKDQEEGSIAHECMHAGHESLGILVEALETGIQDGSIRPDIDPFSTAIILWGQTSGVINLLSLKGQHFEHEHKIDMKPMMEYAFSLAKKSIQKD